MKWNENSIELNKRKEIMNEKRDKSEVKRYEKTNKAI